MKPSIKLGSLVLALMIAFTAVAAGCSLNKEWSYKSEVKELSTGVYIYCLSGAYSQAKTYAEKLKDYDSEKDSWLDMEITDDDGNKEIARTWIKKKAEESCLSFLVVEEQMKVENATYDEAALTEYRNQAKQYWEVGVQQQYQQTPALSTTYSPYGISLESFSYVYADMSVKQDALFDAVYGKGGSKEVKDDELNKYFTDNYVSYSYFSAPLYTSSTDEAGQQKNIAMDDKKIKELKDQFEGYSKDINDNGKKLDDITKAYQKKSGDDTIEPTSATEQLESVSMGDDFKKALKKLGDKKATTITVGEKENAMLYFIYKDSIKDVAKTYLKDGSQKKQVLTKMKSEEFTDYLKELAGKLKYEKNGIVDSYDPKMFFKAVKATTAPATDSTEG
ncbi:MAG TPA: hypothetical protein DEO32_02585 [Ruminococcaceae bacterium]|nr:hypothetical protein [Oscillospiraceae bacterium]